MIWINGEFQESGAAQIGLDDRGLLLGDGLFETILMRDGVPLFLEAHLDRLSAGAAQMDVPFDPTAANFFEIAQRLGQAHNGEASLRLTLTRGGGARGIVPPAVDVRPSLFMTAAPLPPKSSQVLRLHVSQVRRNEGSPLSNVKTLAYGDNILARREAMTTGADEAVLLNNRGEVACASVANVFIVLKERLLITPPLESGCLDGITRAQVLKLAREQGIEAREEPVAPALLAEGSVFLTNCLLGLRPAEMPGASMGHPPLFAALEDGYRKLIEDEIREKSVR